MLLAPWQREPSVSIRSIAVLFALVLAAVLPLGCAAGPAGPRPTLPHPSYAPVVVPAQGATPKPRPDRPRQAATAPQRMTDAEWRVAFCKTQDEVFALQFALTHAAKAGATRDLDAFKAAIRTLSRRIDHARRSLASVPARYARPLVTIQRTMMRTYDQATAAALQVLRTRSMTQFRRFEALGRAADRQWNQMVKANHRLQSGPHRLLCL